MADLTELEKVQGRVRENSMQWALYTSSPGDDPMVILARAQLYADYVLGKHATAQGIVTRQGGDSTEIEAPGAKRVEPGPEGMRP